MTVHPTIRDVTDRIIQRSRERRADYLERIRAAAVTEPRRGRLSCSNLAHGAAACGAQDKAALMGGAVPTIGIVTAYNDMLSAHQPYGGYPDIIKAVARENGATALVAGGVPAMCDGVTQGRPGMELSLFSRDVIALSAAVALSHDMFDAVLFLGICDKIVPGLLTAALSFGHLPAIFVPGGPMTSGLANDEKARIRQLFAEGKIGRTELLEAETKSYHGPGTCTFYGTANSNQMLMEIMGLHLPGASFPNSGTPLRQALTDEATRRALAITAQGTTYTPVGRIVDERAIVNGIVGLHATGGSTNHVLHLIVIARTAGIHITWQDFADVSEVVPLLCRIYPNGQADINHFHAAGGMGFLIAQLLDAGLLHDNVQTVVGPGLGPYCREPRLENGKVCWIDSPRTSGDEKVLAPIGRAFQPTGGLKVLTGNLGTSVAKVSALAPTRRIIEAPARVFHTQEAVKAAFEAGELTGDFIVVVRFQGPKANGMPELHGLTPILGALQARGLAVALVTDGRMSGASGKIPAAIHVSPEAADGGAIAKVRDGDIIRLDTLAGTLQVLADDLDARDTASDNRPRPGLCGQDLFSVFRGTVGPAATGASIFK